MPSGQTERKAAMVVDDSIVILKDTAVLQESTDSICDFFAYKLCSDEVMVGMFGV